jgi:hypothetical protein
LAGSSKAKDGKGSKGEKVGSGAKGSAGEKVAEGDIDAEWKK